jgi:hypothetical protein
MRHAPLVRPMALQRNPSVPAWLIRPMAFGAAGVDFFGRDPCLSPADQAHGFWRRRLSFFGTLTEKSRRRVYCTGLRASWSELAHDRSLSASEKEPLINPPLY